MQGHGSQESKQAAAATQRGSVQSAQESHEESDLASTTYWIDYPMPFLSFYYDTFPAVDDLPRWSICLKATRRVTLRAQCTGLITRCPFSASTMTPFQQLMTYRGGHRLLEHFELIHVELLLLLACSLGSHAPARRVTVTVFIFNGQVFLFLRESVVYWYSI